MNFRLNLLTVFGLGLLRPAPGTWGSLPPPAFALLLIWLIGPSWHVDVCLVLLAAIFTSVCIRFGAEAETHFGRKDPSAVVADEVAGQAIALLFLPWRAFTDTSSFLWNIALAGTAFLMFRAMDIIKPPPAHKLQRLTGGAGIVIDDLLAGVYALALTHLLARFVLPAVLG